MDIQTSEITSLIVQDFELSQQSENIISEAVLLDLLADQIALMIETRLDFLLGLMYRLDIDEGKIRRALAFSNGEAANIGLARLVLERQKQRIWSKKFYKQEKIEDWDDF